MKYIKIADINESIRIINEANNCSSVTINNKDSCPFCGGTKVVAFTRWLHNQKCTECDKNGMISTAKLKRYGLK